MRFYFYIELTKYERDRNSAGSEHFSGGPFPGCIYLECKEWTV